MTIRNVDERLRQAIESEAADRGTSLNRAVLALVRKATGLDGRDAADRREYRDLDDLAGTWSEAEAEAFERALAGQRVVEGHLWPLDN